MEVSLPEAEGAVANLPTEITMSTMENSIMDILKNDIIDFLAHDTRPFFRSQQKDETELTVKEKKDIASSIFHKSKSTFLARFGTYLTLDHLRYFETIPVADNEKYEIKFHLQNIKRYHNLPERHKDIKNRRYQAMQKLISDSSYFSETEMMRREPFLYDQLVGQFMSENERKARDNLDTQNITFVNLLLESIERDQTRNLQHVQENEENEMEEEEDSDEYESSNGSETRSQNTSTGPRWGELDDDVTQPHSSKRPILKTSNYTHKPSYAVLTAPERALLKEEFISEMYNSFLEGRDKDFDYANVDFNSEFECVNIRSTDEEEKYFDEEEVSDEVMNTEDQHSGSDDELDVYMKHLEQHQSLPKKVF